MKKNILLTILVNLFIILIIIIFLDVLFVYYNNNSYIIKNGFRMLPQNKLYSNEKSRDEIFGPARPEQMTNKSPVIISGCSIAYGLFLPFKSTLGSLISKLSGRVVYNKGRNSTCISHVLYELNETNIYDDIENPEYLFFIYDPVLHSNRINTDLFNPMSQISYLKYKLDHGTLENISNKNIPFISALSIYRLYTYNKNINNSLTDYNKSLTIALFNEVNKKIHEKFPDIKFIVILYEGNMFENDHNNAFFKDIISSLSENDIEVVSVNEMLEDDSNQEKYKSDGAHPTTEVWEKVSEKLVKKYKL